MSLKTVATEDVLTPDYFDKLNNLRHLDLSGGDLKQIEPGCFQALSNLKSLNLGNNHIEYLEPASLEGLTLLRSLNLRKNAIRQLPPAIARLKNLKHLEIRANPLECNCATLKVRDVIIKKGVAVSKKIVCVAPSYMKGTTLMKLNTTIICNFEQQDREMQNDQPEASETDLGSGGESNEEVEDEYTDINNNFSDKPDEAEVETPFPTSSVDSITGSPIIESTGSLESIATNTTSKHTSSLGHTGENEEIFFDNEEKKEQLLTTEMSHKTEGFKDSLFYPTTGSGEGEEDSDEGSGIDSTREENNEKDGTTEKQSESLFDNLLSIFGFGSSGTTADPSETKDINLEEEEFINASPTTANIDEPIVSSKNHLEESDMTTKTTTDASIANGVEVIKPIDTDDETKLDNVKADVDELAEVSTAKQSKKGMGSYVVLATLLAVLAALIGFAAYKGDFCRKKRKRDDTEAGTELKDMHKSLLPDTGNSTQPKVTSNGNTENIPLVDGIPDSEKIVKVYTDNHQTEETPRSLNGTVDHPDPVKPSRKLIIPQNEHKIEERPRIDVNSLRESFLTGRTSPAEPSEPSSITTNDQGPTTCSLEPNGPPLSPGAQRVKITLQEIPESVPKTPILITRTMAGENLVKTP